MQPAVPTPQDARQRIEDCLHACPVLLDWSPCHLRELAAAARIAHYRRRTALAVREDQRREILLVVSGSVEIAATSAAGDKYILSVMGPGQFARLVQLLDDAPMYYTCHARKASEIIHIPGAAMRRILDAEPALWSQIAQLMLHRYHIAIEARQNQVLGSVRRRIAIVLVNLVQRYGDRPSRTGSFDSELHISQADLADIVGVSRQTINKELGQLRVDGVLGRHEGYGVVTLRDFPALLRIAKTP